MGPVCCETGFPGGLDEEKIIFVDQKAEIFSRATLVISASEASEKLAIFDRKNSIASATFGQQFFSQDLAERLAVVPLAPPLVLSPT